ncbi:MAG: NADH-quinone oxidoreductase subunit A [Candidatus Nitrosocaldaceae archaeon]
MAETGFDTLWLMILFGILASVPALILAKIVAPRRRFVNPVKFLPMECGQVPLGEGKARFMMQYYAYVIMFVVFDVMTIFLYVWGTSLLALPQVVTIPIIVFLAILGAAMGYAMYLSGKKDIW